jgi:predicted GNAT family N-acyltransferase
MASASDNRPAMKAKEVANRFSGNLQITVARKPAEMEDALSVRRAVFIEEQGVPEAEEIDTYDGDPGQATGAVHVVAYLDEQPLATGRLLLDALPGENAHIGRVAVLRQHRRRGLGRTVTLALHREAQRRGYGAVTVAAQLRAMPFYERLGYRAYGDVFLDAGIEHRLMDLTLCRPRVTNG